MEWEDNIEEIHKIDTDFFDRLLTEKVKQVQMDRENTCKDLLRAVRGETRRIEAVLMASFLESVCQMNLLLSSAAIPR